jgi:hypothetical protein
MFDLLGAAIRDRPKGWSLCAGKSVAAFNMIFAISSAEFVGIYSQVCFNAVVGPVIFSNGLFILMPIVVIVFLISAFAVNSGKYLFIYIFNILFYVSILFFFVLNIFAISVSMFAHFMGHTLYGFILPSILVLALMPYFIYTKINCRWLNIRSTPTEWEPRSQRRRRV